MLLQHAEYQAKLSYPEKLWPPSECTALRFRQKAMAPSVRRVGVIALRFQQKSHDPDELVYSPIPGKFQFPAFTAARSASSASLYRGKCRSFSLHSMQMVCSLNMDTVHVFVSLLHLSHFILRLYKALLKEFACLSLGLKQNCLGPFGIKHTTTNHTVRVGLVLTVCLDIVFELFEFFDLAEVSFSKVIPCATVVLSLEDFQINIFVLFLVVHASIIRFF